MLGRGGILLCPRGFPAVTVRLKLRDGAAKSPCTCGLDSEIYSLIVETICEVSRIELTPEMVRNPNTQNFIVEQFAELLGEILTP